MLLLPAPLILKPILPDQRPAQSCAAYTSWIPNPTQPTRILLLPQQRNAVTRRNEGNPNVSLLPLRSPSSSHNQAPNSIVLLENALWIGFRPPLNRLQPLACVFILTFVSKNSWPPWRTRRSSSPFVSSLPSLFPIATTTNSAATTSELSLPLRKHCASFYNPGKFACFLDAPFWSVYPF